MDDAIFIEPRLGRRPEVVVLCWGSICRKLLGEDSLNQDKLMEEGDWESTHILLGYEVNVDTLIIRLPVAKVGGAWEMIHDPVFQPGNRITPVKKVQILRGLINRWSGASRFWKYMTAPFNALIGYAGGTGAWVRCGNDQMWIAVWNLMRFLLKCSQDHTTWDALFEGTLLDLIPVSKRLSFPVPVCQTMWATGDAALGRFAAINWTTKEFIVEDSVEYLDDVNPNGRRVIISDVEQLAATSIMVTWGEPGTVLLLGTDNQNVLAWAHNGFAKLGIALTLNQETAKWLSRNKVIVEGFYLRCGHNFSADWMSRANLDEILDCAESAGFRRMRFKARRGAFISNWKQNQSDGWEPGPVMIEREIPCFEGKCAEWNSAGGGLTRAAMDMGVPVEYLYPRRTSVVEWAIRNCGLKPYMARDIALLGGAAQDEHEVAQFECAIETNQPKTAVIMAPLGLELEESRWGHVYIIDGTQHGDVLAGVCQIGMGNLVPIHCFVEEPMNPPLCAIHDRYRICGINPCGDGRGIVDTQEVPYCNGMEVWIRPDTGSRTLSLNSHIRPRSLNDIRSGCCRKGEFGLSWAMQLGRKTSTGMELWKLIPCGDLPR